MQIEHIFKQFFPEHSELVLFLQTWPLHNLVNGVFLRMRFMSIGGMYVLSYRFFALKGLAHSKNENLYFLALAQTKRMQPFLVSSEAPFRSNLQK